MKIRIFLLFIFSFYLGTSLTAAEVKLVDKKVKEGHFKAKLSGEEVYLGEPFYLSFNWKLENCQSCSILFSEFEPENLLFKNKGCRTIQKPLQIDCQFEFFAKELEKQEIPEIKLALQKNSETLEEISIGPLSVVAKEKKINPEANALSMSPVEVEREIIWPYYVLLGLLIGLFLFYIIWRIQKNRKKIAPKIIIPPQEPPFEKAVFYFKEVLEKLDRGKAVGLIEVFQLSDWMRLCVTFRYKIGGLELTSTELKRKMSQKRVERNMIRDVDNFLSYLDQLKFAGLELESQAIIPKTREALKTIETLREAKEI